MKMKNICQLILKFSHFAVKNLYFKRSFNNIIENPGVLFSRINFDQTYLFWGDFVRGFLAWGIFVQGVLSGSLCSEFFVRAGLCPRTLGGYLKSSDLQVKCWNFQETKHMELSCEHQHCNLPDTNVMTGEDQSKNYMKVKSPLNRYVLPDPLF